MRGGSTLVVPAHGLFLGAIASLIMDAELHTLPGRGALMSKDHTAATHSTAVARPLRRRQAEGRAVAGAAIRARRILKARARIQI